VLGAFGGASLLGLILKKLPHTGQMVIIGHGLGSVIAAGLLQRLPTGLEVVGLLTSGSPLASGRFEVEKLRESMQEPPTNLAWWATSGISWIQ
jgi:hypothetical protein